MIRNIRFRHAKAFLLWAGATYGYLWILVESLGFFFQGISLAGFFWYGVLLISSASVGVWRALPAQRVEISIAASDSSFKIRFGNIFEGEGVIVIPVNEYFDGDLGDHVSTNSLHGKFIASVLGGQSEAFFRLTQAALAEIEPAATGVKRTSGQCTRYPIGTVARMEINQKKYLLAALSQTDLDSLKASATLEDLMACLSGIWAGIREYSGGMPVNVPLVGSGLSGVGLPPTKLIEIIMTSFLYQTKERKVADKVTLVLPHQMGAQIDLRDIKRSWTNAIQER